MAKKLTEWDGIIRDIVSRIKRLKSENVPPGEIAKGFVALKALNCGIRIVEVSGKEYLRVRWFGGGDRNELEVGPMDYSMRKILKRAGLYLEAASSPS